MDKPRESKVCMVVGVAQSGLVVLTAVKDDGGYISTAQLTPATARWLSEELVLAAERAKLVKLGVD